MKSDVCDVMPRIVGKLHGFVSPLYLSSDLMVACHDRNHKPVFTFTHSDRLNFLCVIEAPLPCGFKPFPGPGKAPFPALNDAWSPFYKRRLWCYIVVTLSYHLGGLEWSNVLHGTGTVWL